MGAVWEPDGAPEDFARLTSCLGAWATGAVEDDLRTRTFEIIKTFKHKNISKRKNRTKSGLTYVYQKNNSKKEKLAFLGEKHARVCRIFSSDDFALVFHHLKWQFTFKLKENQFVIFIWFFIFTLGLM